MIHTTELYPAAQDFLRQVEELKREEEEREKQHYIELRKYVNSLSKAELQEKLYVIHL